MKRAYVFVVYPLIFCFLVPIAYIHAVSGPQLARVGNQPYIKAALAPERAKEELWKVQTNVALYAVNAHLQFDPCHNKSKIENYIFNDTLDLRDIYLASKLSEQGLLSTTNIFGKIPAEQYLAQLAPTHLHFQPEYSERGCLFRAVYSFKPKRWEKTSVHIGTTFSIKQIDHTLILEFEETPGSSNGGRISANSISIVPVSGSEVILESNISQFFTDSVDMFSFFADFVLGPKNLTLDTFQQRTGFGDLGLFVELEVPEANFWFGEKLNVGAALTLPTGNKQTATIIWEIELGNGGAMQVDLYGSLTFKKIKLFGTVTAAAAIRFSAPFTKPLRIPQIKARKNEVLLPTRFQSYFINTPTGTFEAVDSISAALADEIACARITYGLTGIFTISNDFDWPEMGCGFGLIYQASVKALDAIRACKPGTQYVVAIAELQSDTVAHTITGLMRWQFKRGDKQDYEVNLGTEAVVAGKNVLNTHKLFVGLTMSF